MNYGNSNHELGDSGAVSAFRIPGRLARPFDKCGGGADLSDDILSIQVDRMIQSWRCLGRGANLFWRDLGSELGNIYTLGS